MTTGDQRWRLWYDDQCEVCQAGVAWLRWLDRGRGRVDPIQLSRALEEGALPRAGVEELSRHLHVAAPDGRLLVGASAVAALARLFALTTPVGRLAQLPGLAWLADRLYGWVAANRYSLSRCRGGACTSVRQDLVQEQGARGAFRICRTVGAGLIAPLAALAFARRLGRQARLWARTRGRTATLLDGRLSIHFLGGGPSGTVSLLFGELFTAVRYGTVLIDPGGTRMRRSLKRHLAPRPERIASVVPTHLHEEHVGNLDLAAELTGAAVVAHPRALPLLPAPPRIGLMRALVIGQPRPLRAPASALGCWIACGFGESERLEVIETPGHCPEHVSLYSARDRLLIAGDAFMGTHFSSPNDDVDHRAWITALERLLALPIDVMVEAHGHVHTLRGDVLRDLEACGLACIASRRDPHELLWAKLDFLRWVGEQLALGAREGLPARAVAATVFPWTQRWSYETVLQDALAALVSGRAFGRHKLVRSFRSPAAADGELPWVYELRG
jgi:glyoxylase-like metal-dependent hydrolase (beta-lactamase superfamily II)/predicted DCC family thiol-disulfide oxidoreductase YuxK